MFEAAELGRRLSKADYEAQLPELRARLLEAQQALREQQRGVILLIEGVDGAGRGEAVNRLLEWLDTRGVETQVYWQPSDEELERPSGWRFWRTLPARGRIGILFGAWYQQLLTGRIHGELKAAALDRGLQRAKHFERMLALDGFLILKFWLHLPEDVQKRQLKRLKRDPSSRWRRIRGIESRKKERGRLLQVAEHVIRESDSGFAPWYFVEAADARYRDLTIAQTLLAAIEARSSNPLSATADDPPSPPALLPESATASVTILDHVDLSQALSSALYRHELAELQERLRGLVWEAYEKRRSTILVFEGWDAAGKGGAIRRLTAGMDARLYQVIPIAAPSDEEKAHHYLWRFWRHIPRAGRVILFDRSWYGRVLVERVEGFARPEEWQRAYHEINNFESELAAHGMVVVKFWLHIDPEEQLRRFQQREETEYKRYKITEEDWRNREQWEAYKAAVNEMVVRTSTDYAPWELIPANDKRFARVAVLRAVCDRLSRS